MFENLVNKVKDLIQQANQPRVAPAELFNDPLAAQIDWTPAKGGGTNFRTHKLRAAGPHRLEFRLTAGAKLFGGLFVTIGAATMIGGIAALLAGAFQKDGGTDWAPMIMLPLFGLVFGGVGGGMLYFMSIPRVFDKDSGFYWKGRISPSNMLAGEMEIQADKFTKLTDIHAIQLLSEYIHGNKSSYYSYELNLITHDGKRINVIDHGNKTKLIEDAELMGVFLNVPVWNYI
ncbi:MAG: hypothetical protein ABFD92_00420 [Planctomycetaceae bacterium]|nr:hypothetical protein [Planctomycetaceae bacterium]